MKKILLVLCLLVFTFAFTGCGAETEEFDRKGITIVLPSYFEEIESEKWDFYVASDKVDIMSDRVSKYSNINDLDFSTLSLEEYMNYILLRQGIQESTTTYLVEGYYATFYYCYYTVNEEFGYMMMIAESDAFFYIINLATDYDIFQETKPLLMEYAVKIQIE